MFNRYRNEIKKQTGKSIKILRCDRGGEYLSSEFLTYLGENRILSLWNRTLLDMVRSMMSFATLPVSFLGLALVIACYILNRVSSYSVNKIPYEIWIGYIPRLSHLRVWEYPVYVKYLMIDKLGARSDRCGIP